MDETPHKPRARLRAAVADPYLPLDELATHAGLSVRTLRSYLHHPTTPLPHYMVGGKIVVRRSEYDTWIQVFRVADVPTDQDARIDALVRGH